MNVYRAAIAVWGERLQLVVAMEELSELMSSISKEVRYRKEGTPWKLSKNTAEEIADVEIMLEQLKVIGGEDFAEEVGQIRSEKIARLIMRIERVNDGGK